MWTIPGAKATNASRKRPCQRSAKRVRAPASRLALLRTISEIIGRPPIAATTTLAVPTASRSRFMSVLRFHGSSRSIALAESSDSTLPTRANITTHQAAASRVAGDVNTEKSGRVTAASRFRGTLTRNDWPTG